MKFGKKTLKNEIKNKYCWLQRLREMARKVQNSCLFSAKIFILAENKQFRSFQLVVAETLNIYFKRIIES